MKEPTEGGQGHQVLYIKSGQLFVCHSDLKEVFKNIYILLFIFGCARSSLLDMGCFQLWRAGGYSLLWRMGSVAPWHVETSQTRGQTCVYYIGRQIQWTTTEVQYIKCFFFFKALKTVPSMESTLYTSYYFFQNGNLIVSVRLYFAMTHSSRE